MLTGPALAAAAKNDWQTVFFLLALNQFHHGAIVNIHARNLEHPQGFRLIDYAEHNNSSLIPALCWYGATISYDIKLFKAAALNNWEYIFYLVDNRIVDINTENIMHPERWRVLDYAANLLNSNALVTALVQRGAIATTNAAKILATAKFTQPVADANEFAPDLTQRPQPIIFHPRPLRVTAVENLQRLAKCLPPPASLRNHK